MFINVVPRHQPHVPRAAWSTQQQPCRHAAAASSGVEGQQQQQWWRANCPVKHFWWWTCRTHCLATCTQGGAARSHLQWLTPVDSKRCHSRHGELDMADWLRSCLCTAFIIQSFMQCSAALHCIALHCDTKPLLLLCCWLLIAHHHHRHTAHSTDCDASDLHLCCCCYWECADVCTACMRPALGRPTG